MTQTLLALNNKNSGAWTINYEEQSSGRTALYIIYFPYSKSSFVHKVNIQHDLHPSEACVSLLAYKSVKLDSGWVVCWFLWQQETLSSTTAQQRITKLICLDALCMSFNQMLTSDSNTGIIHFNDVFHDKLYLSSCCHVVTADDVWLLLYRCFGSILITVCSLSSLHPGAITITTLWT